MWRILKDLFSIANGNYNLCSQPDFRVPSVRTIFYGVNLFRYFGSAIWSSLLNDLRNICDFDWFKMGILGWNQLTVIVGCVKTTLTALVSLLFQVNCSRQVTQVFFIRFCKNKISFSCYSLESCTWNNQEYNWWKSIR